MALPATAPFEATRVLVRPVEKGDLPALMAVNGDEETTRFLPYAAWRTLADAEAWLTRMRALEAGGTARQYVVVGRDEGRAIGTCLIFRHDEGSRRAELGYVLARTHQGQGLMREALTALIDGAFGPMNLRRLEAEVDPRNVASTRLVEALGFTREGVLRERWGDGADAYDVAAWGLLDREWAARIRAPRA